MQEGREEKKSQIEKKKKTVQTTFNISEMQNFDKG